MEKFIKILEDEDIDTIEAMQDLSNKEYKDLGFTIGMIKKIKRRLAPEENKVV